MNKGTFSPQTQVTKTIIVVLGMHRSGTSVLTRSLKVFGVDLGTNLLPPDDNNEKGYWEDRDIYFLNIKILEHFDADYQSLEPIFPDFFNKDLNRFKLEAIELIRNKMDKIDCFGFKDPRTTRLLPFWRSVFNELNLNVKYLIALRNPLSVVSSLAKREGFAYEKGYMLWYEYTLSCLMETQDEVRLIVDYDRLITHPVYELERISKILNFSFDPLSESFIAFQSEFIDRSLRHTQYQPEELYLESLISQDIVDLFQIAYKSSIDEMSLNDNDVYLKLKQSVDQLKKNHFIYRYLKHIEEKLHDVMEQNEQLTERHTITQLNHLNYVLDNMKLNISW